MSTNSFNARGTLQVGDRTYEIYRLNALAELNQNIHRLPVSIRILLENLLRHEDGGAVSSSDIETLARWNAHAVPVEEIAFTPARVLMQDFTGVPAVVDLAAMRDAMAKMGGDPNRINPLQPAELVIDHSVQVDAFGRPDAMRINTELEYERNQERYQFLRWGQDALRNFKVVPPETGIVHQVNLEFLARVVFPGGYMNGATGPVPAYPDTLVGTDSHTTMINGLGVLGWGVGGIEAEAAMLGQPVSMLIPNVVGFRLTGELREGATATDLVLVVVEMLRNHGVVGKFVEFYGPGLSRLPLADRATIANMAPEYGATCGFFPVDAETIRYLRFSGRSDDHANLVEAYMKEQGMFHTADSPEPEFAESLELDLSTVEPSIAGPKRPQDRILLSNGKKAFYQAVDMILNPGGLQNAEKNVSKWESEGGNGQTHDFASDESAVRFTHDDAEHTLHHGSVVIAAITSCTNTSNPSVMVASGLLAKKAAALGLKAKPWVKTSLAPGSKVVTRYLENAGLLSELEKLGFHVVGYGCTTCIGNSGPLPDVISETIREGNLVACSVLSGNRNFEGRINPDVKANYLASPPLVVAYALAGRMDIDLYNEPLGQDQDGNDVFLKDIWPSRSEVTETVEEALKSEMFSTIYQGVFEGNEIWKNLNVPTGDLFAWDGDSTYVQHPPYFEGMTAEAPSKAGPITGARVLALLGDSVTTDHISPAGSIKKDSPAGEYLMAHGVLPKDFNSYGSRRGNHEVMMRGTFANVRLRNQLAPGTEGGFTNYLPEDRVTSIYEASMKYKESGTPLIVIAGKEYGTGSSRDWAAKGPMLLGVRAAIAESYERIHRSNLIGMGILPLEFLEDESAKTLGLTGKETFDIIGLTELFENGFPAERRLTVKATGENGNACEFTVKVRIDTPQEMHYYLNGGILQYVLRGLLAQPKEEEVEA
ncbi:MAG: aconitate hydratase AcnA [Ignavibacteriae bacterium]|nr:aconitate hydratase AcnA [Ignavibacteriota bacterium]MCB9214597.1 aconitate hydratase AcnA [Ignavibacteria bacterium]